MNGHAIGSHARAREEIGARVAAHQRARHPRCAGHVAVRHPGVAVLLELDRPRPAVLDRVAEAMQRAHARVAAVGEHQLARRADPEHLVVEQVRRHPDQLQLAPPLAQHLVAGGERDQVREALQRHRIAVVHELGDGLAEREDLSHVRRANDCASCEQATGSGFRRVTRSRFRGVTWSQSSDGHRRPGPRPPRVPGDGCGGDRGRRLRGRARHRAGRTRRRRPRKLLRPRWTSRAGRPCGGSSRLRATRCHLDGFVLAVPPAPRAQRGRRAPACVRPRGDRVSAPRGGEGRAGRARRRGGVPRDRPRADRTDRQHVDGPRAGLRRRAAGARGRAAHDRARLLRDARGDALRGAPHRRDGAQGAAVRRLGARLRGRDGRAPGRVGQRRDPDDRHHLGALGDGREAPGPRDRRPARRAQRAQAGRAARAAGARRRARVRRRGDAGLATRLRSLRIGLPQVALRPAGNRDRLGPPGGVGDARAGDPELRPRPVRRVDVRPPGGRSATRRGARR